MHQGIKTYSQLGAYTAATDADPHTLMTMLFDGALERIASAEGSTELALPQEEVQALHVKRQRLTAELYKTMPTPMPPVLRDLVACLHEKTKKSLASMTALQQETREAVLKLQQHRKAKSAYQSMVG